MVALSALDRFAINRVHLVYTRWINRSYSPLILAKPITVMARYARVVYMGIPLDTKKAFYIR